MISREVVLFIDAGFLSKLSKHFGDGKYLKFNYLDFFKFLAKKENCNLRKVYYYTAPPFQSEKPTEDEMRRKRGYDKFISNFKKIDFLEIREGRVQRVINSKGETEFNQKGVDTLMTLDLAFVKERFGDVKVILITSDTDFVPVINELVKRNSEVILFTYKDSKKRSDFILSQYLFNSCSVVKYLTKEDLIKFKF